MSERPDAPTPLSLLTGELDREAALDLLRRAEQDPEASAELDLVCDLVAAWPEVRSRDDTSSESDQDGKRHRGRRGTLLAMVAGLAAAAAVLLWTLWPGVPGDDALLQALGGPPRYVASELRSDETGTRAAFDAAIAPYRAGDHAAAEASLARYLEAHPTSATARFYRGAALVELGRLAEARAAFEAVAAEAPGYLGEHARWRLALAWLSDGEDGRARTELETLRSGGGAFAVNARELLDVLAER